MKRPLDRQPGPEARSAQIARERIHAAARGHTASSPAKTRRWILPSQRVVEFQIPKIAQYMDILEKAHMDGQRESNGEALTNAAAGHFVTREALRQLLVAVSAAPVKPIQKPDWDPSRAEQAARESITALVRDKLGLEPDAEFEGDQIDVLNQEIEARLPDVIEDLRYQAEDTEAMKAAANMLSIADAQWEDPEHYLRRIQGADVGTEEADDWDALHTTAARIIVELNQLRSLRTYGPDPKGGRPKPRRPCRS